jgi:hypothetical protein
MTFPTSNQAATTTAGACNCTDCRCVECRCGANTACRCPREQKPA